MSRFSVLVGRFDGGLNTKVSHLDGALNESPDMQDSVFDDLGAVKTRLGKELFTSAGIASYNVDMLHSFFQDDGTKELMTVVNESLYRFSANTAIIIASGTSFFTQGVRVQAVNYQNRMWISNGGVVPHKWDGTEFLQWGIPTPSAPSALTGSNGTLTGAYQYVILGLNSSSVQGDYGSASVDIAVSSSEIDLSDIPVFPASSGVDIKQICRNTANASGIFLVVTEISNPQTTYTDTNADSQLLTAAPLDQGVPPYFTTFITHEGRMFGASSTGDNPTFLYFSPLNEPELFPSENFLRIGDGDGFPIIGIAILSNHLIVAKNDGKGQGSMWLIYMPNTNEVNWTVTKLDTESGGQSTNVMIKFGNFLAYLNDKGIYDINEFAVGDIKSDAISFNIEPDIFALSSSFLSQSFAVTWQNKVWFSVPYGETAGLPTEINNRVYQYDFVKGRGGEDRELGAWSRFSNMAISTFAIHNGELYGGSSSDDGIIYKLDTGNSDAGVAINSYFKTMAIHGLDEHQNHTKIWRFAYITVAASGDWFMDVEVLAASELEGNTVQVSLAPGGAVYGTAVLDTDFWGPGKNKKIVKVDFTNIVAKYIQLKFSTNAVDQYFQVDKLEVFYNLRGLRGGDA